MGDAPTMEELCVDLAEEHAWIRDQVVALDEGGLATATPAVGWTIRDQLTHLAYFDDRAVQAAVDPEGFRTQVERALADFDAYERAHLDVGRSLSPTELVGWFVGSRERLVNLFRSIDPKERLAWYGPPMSARSSATARYMETWAHGLDVADALSLVAPATDRVRHVCDLGVRTRGWSYAVRNLPEPSDAVRVTLVAPSGARWQWGQEDTGGRVEGPAVDFAMVVTQRRNLLETALEVTGASAAEWMAIAQCFAGPPGPGR